jgi:hypothetical protein
MQTVPYPLALLAQFLLSFTATTGFPYYYVHSKDLFQNTVYMTAENNWLQA